jgi:hypothetical protein
MSRMRSILSATALAALLAVPAHAAPEPRLGPESLWQWVVGIWQDISLTIDPDGIRGTIDPNGSSANTDGSGEGDIRWTIDPNG